MKIADMNELKLSQLLNSSLRVINEYPQEQLDLLNKQMDKMGLDRVAEIVSEAPTLNMMMFSVRNASMHTLTADEAIEKISKLDTFEKYVIQMARDCEMSPFDTSRVTLQLIKDQLEGI